MSVPEDTVNWTLRVPAPEVMYVSAILEGYEGLCLGTTPEGHDALLVLQVGPGQTGLLREVLSSLELAEAQVEILEAPPEAQATSGTE
jgi:uncharacterized protein DUF4911